MTQRKFRIQRAGYGRKLNISSLAAKLKIAEESVSKNKLSDFRPGDTVKVQVRIKEGNKERLQSFEGVCIKMRNRGPGKSFTVRKISHGVGVERSFSFSSPTVAAVEVIQSGRVRRAKLYYLRDLEGRAAKIDRDVRVGAEGGSSGKTASE